MPSPLTGISLRAAALQPSPEPDEAPDPRPPRSLDPLPPGRGWREVPSARLGLRLRPAGAFAWQQGGRSTRPCQAARGNRLFQVPLAPRLLLCLFFGGNGAEKPIIGEVSCGEAGLTQGKAVLGCPTVHKSCWDCCQLCPAPQGRTCCRATPSLLVPSLVAEKIRKLPYKKIPI